MNYKALFLDVDGTTVLHGIANMPTPKVTQAIQACEKAGVRVSFASSRPPRAVAKILNHVHISGYCVLTSGAQIYNPVNRKVIFEETFPINAVAPIYAIANQVREAVTMYDGSKEVPYEGKMILRKLLGMSFPAIPPEKSPHIMEELSQIPGISVHRMEAWDRRYECLDIVNEHTSKLHGIIKVMEREGLKSDQIIGVGDGYNDFPLLMACGLKIAMGNAVPELKAIADFVAPPVEEDGVATVIEKFILEKS